MRRHTVLICDDNIAIHRSLTTCLKSDGIDVISVYDGGNPLYESYADTRVVDTLISRLRQKLSQNDVHFAIRSVYGIGYKIEELPRKKQLRKPAFLAALFLIIYVLGLTFGAVAVNAYPYFYKQKNFSTGLRESFHNNTLTVQQTFYILQQIPIYIFIFTMLRVNRFIT